MANINVRPSGKVKVATEVNDGVHFPIYQNKNKISTLNSHDATTFAAAAVFQGVGEDVSSYGRVGVAINTSNATDGTLTMEVSHDNVTWGGPTRAWADTRFGQPHMWNIVEKYFRIKYTNGTTEANDLSIQVQYSSNADVLLGHQLDETLIDEVEAVVVRAVGVGQDPDNLYANTGISGVDSDNSSSTNLTTATSLVFTGTFHNVSNYIGISVLVEGAAATTVGGTLQMQFSHDGITAHRNIVISELDVSAFNPRTLGVVSKFFRIIFTADSDLTSFDVQTMFHTQQVQLVSRLDQILTGKEDVSFVRSTTVPHLDIAREQITSQGTDLIFGFNNDLDTGVWEDISPKGGDMNWPTSAAVVGISSSDAADTSAGVGTRQVEIHGLSSTGADQKETVTLSGITEVDTTLSYIRVTKMHNETVGTYGGSHQGDITARVGSSGAKTGDILAVMTGLEGAVDTSVQYGTGEMQGGHWSVPLGKVAYLIGGEVIINTTGTKTADIVLYEREGILLNAAPYLPRRILWEAIETQGIVPIDLRHFQKIKALTDIWFRAKASANNTKISVKLHFYVLDQNAEGA